MSYPQQQPAVPTDAEKARARHHLGYLGVQEAYTFVFGVPAGVETQFAIEGAFRRLLPESMPIFRDLIAKLDATECQIFEFQESLIATKVGSIELSGREGLRAMFKQYDYWRQGLANLLGSYANPFDKRGAELNESVNVRVQG